MRRKENIPFFLFAEKKQKTKHFGRIGAVSGPYRGRIGAVSGPYRDDFGYPALLGLFSFKK